MLREAKRRALEQDIANVEWVQGGSDDLHRLQPVLGRFDLVTIGTPFHFMEPRATLGDLSRIAADGAVVVAYNGSPMWLHPDTWAESLLAVLGARLGPCVARTLCHALAA